MIEYSESRVFGVLFKTGGSVVPEGLLYGLPSALIAVLILAVDLVFPESELRSVSGISDMTGGQYFAASSAIAVLLIGFRTRQALGRFWEGTSLLHQMRGEWFESASCLVAFSRIALKDRPDEVREFRHTLVRLMSLCHGAALQEIKDEDGAFENFEVLDLEGLDETTLEHLEQCKSVHGFNRVEVLMHMVQTLITHYHEIGIVKIAPPILSRVYQTLSRGYVNLLNAMKIKHTRFPFPYAQLMAMMNIALTIWTPFIVTANVTSIWIAAVVSFIPVFGMVCLNAIAIQLEMPFGNDPNDLPLDDFQFGMNKALLLLLHPGADLLPGTSQSCKFDFLAIADNGFKRHSVRHAHTILLEEVEAPMDLSSRVWAAFGMTRDTSPSSSTRIGRESFDEVGGSGSVVGRELSENLGKSSSICRAQEVVTEAPNIEQRLQLQARTLGHEQISRGFRPSEPSPSSPIASRDSSRSEASFRALSPRTRAQFESSAPGHGQRTPLSLGATGSWRDSARSSLPRSPHHLPSVHFDDGIPSGGTQDEPCLQGAFDGIDVIEGPGAVDL